MLNHPNVLTVYDIGTHERAPYIVTELLEGATLREQLRGAALPLRRAIDYAVQIARGLAAAHEKGIVHRDLKPENLFITKDGRVKILDFGLAKLRQSLSGAAVDADARTHSLRTAPNVVMGTIGYMSPEQVRAEEVDHRSDIFAFGAILYEMLAGQQAFRGASAAETMNAILNEDPPELSQMNRNVAPALERLVRHCLEKSAEERFQSARDLAFALEALSGISGPSVVAQAVAPVRSKRRFWFLLANTILIAAVALAAFFIFTEGGEGGGAGAAVYLRKTDGSPAIRLGAGEAHALSPDGEWALATRGTRSPQQLVSQVVLLPTGPGESKTLTNDQIAWRRAIWFPDGKRVLLNGSEQGRGLRS